MSHALAEPPAERTRWLRRLVLQGITVVILGWVSYGSHEVLTWIGMPWWPAWLYPAIVDLAVLYVTPFAVDAELPDSQQWPLRRHAKGTRRMILPVVTLFNILHMLLFVQQHQPSVPEPGMEVATNVVAYIIAVIAGCIPVAVYARVTTLETMDKALEVHLSAEARRTVTQNMEQKRLNDEQFARQQEADQAAHDRKMEQLQAETEANLAAQEQARIARESRRESRSETRATPAAVRSESPRVNNGNPQVTELLAANPKLEDLVAALPPGKKGDRVKALLQNAWNAGIDLNGTDAARLVGCEVTTGRKAAIALKAEGWSPSERPHLVALGRS
jgi:hypothetical protein